MRRKTKKEKKYYYYFLAPHFQSKFQLQRNTKLWMVNKLFINHHQNYYSYIFNFHLINFILCGIFYQCKILWIREFVRWNKTEEWKITWLKFMVKLYELFWAKLCLFFVFLLLLLVFGGPSCKSKMSLRIKNSEFARISHELTLSFSTIPQETLCLFEFEIHKKNGECGARDSNFNIQSCSKPEARTTKTGNLIRFSLPQPCVWAFIGCKIQIQIYYNYLHFA